ncbi:MAG: hypothetical protein K0V04_07690 [Deltaproteobacteria bacterium]|nr:hypothetical protein [Deltaproteobacteria bacterium]
MTFRHYRSNTHAHTAADKHRALLLRALQEHASAGIDVLELRRHMGSRGYVPTGDRWEDDGDGVDVEDGDGETLLLGGSTPEDLVAELFDAAQQDMAETGDSRNYQVLALRCIQGEDRDGQEVVFKLALPKAAFETSTDGAPQSDQHDANMAVFQLLLSHNQESHRVTMDMARQYPALLSRVTDLFPKLTEVLEQLAEQVTDGRRFDVEKVMALLDHEATREARWMEHDRARQRADHRAGFANQAFDLTGPAIKELIATLMAQVFAPKSEATATQQENTTVTQQPTPTTSGSTATPPSSSPLAQRLDALLAAVSDDKLTQARQLLSPDEWSLIAAARAAGDDDEFRALFDKLAESWRAHGKDHTQQLMTELAEALGMRTVMGLGELLREVQGG